MAVAQLDRDGGEDAEDFVALAFQFRETAEATADETSVTKTEFGVSPFFTPCGPRRALGSESTELDFSIGAPTTSKNLFRVLRALQVRPAFFMALFCALLFLMHMEHETERTDTSRSCSFGCLFFHQPCAG